MNSGDADRLWFMKHSVVAAFVLVVAAAAWAWSGLTEGRDTTTGGGLGRNGGGPRTESGGGGFPGYDFANPTASFVLPAQLTEISALTDIDDHTVACVQDEIGAVFLIDIRSGAVTRRLPFGADGDYEGLTRVDDTLWVLRSDGLMIELEMRGNVLAQGRQVKLDLEQRDIEGLGYDPEDRVVLVAPKSLLKGGKAERARRQVYRFDPASGTRLDGLALDTTTRRIIADAERLGIRLPTKTTKRGRERIDLDVRFASIAVHPRTHRLYALSGVDRAVLVFTRDGALFAAHVFDRIAMPKPEGITFLANGDVVIASEGEDSPPRVQVFRYQGE